MGWFKNLFKKKPGGTRLGNLLRTVGDHYTAGIYSMVFPAPPNIAMPVLTRYAEFTQRRGVFSNLIKPGGLLGAAGGVLNGSGVSGDPNATAVENLLTTVGADLMSGNLNIDDLSDEVIDTIDQALGDTMPGFVQDLMGIDQHGNVVNQDVANNGGWNVSIDVGGGNNGNNTGGGNTNNSNGNNANDSEGQMKWVQRALQWVKQNVVTVAVASTALVGGVIYFVIKKTRGYGW